MKRARKHAKIDEMTDNYAHLHSMNEQNSPQITP
jgi:hypothetical protein